jgi:uncharacterized membrane protein YcaP (DUF421 family)
MKPEEVKLTDWMRILMGEVPWSFLVEGVVRIAFLYLLILLSMRLMGKRMAGQLSRNEMAALVSLAATVGIPMQVPDRGLLPALVIALVIIGIQRWVAQRAFKNKRFEYLALDDIGILVKDGCFQFDEMKRAILARERLIAQLRSKGIDHLGKVKRVYMESRGAFTIKEQVPAQPGLSLLPHWDEEMLGRQKQAKDTFACINCGKLSEGSRSPFGKCPECGKSKWVPAVVS